LEFYSSLIRKSRVRRCSTHTTTWTSKRDKAVSG